MLFTSLEFVLFFLPVTLCIYYVLPGRFRNSWLFLSSLFFYAWGEPRFVVVMLLSILVNYLTARLIEEVRYNRKKLVLYIGLILNLLLLFVFKYLNFVINTIHIWIPSTLQILPKTNIALPIGISFFTFQAISYIIDVYRGTPAQKNFINIGLYISMFPQLIAGPIVRYVTVMEQIRERRTELDDFFKGLFRFVIGFNKKILLANVLAEVADAAFTTENLSVSMAWLGAVCYSLQIYYDFGGYSDMAIGLGHMLGFSFLENFNYPYISRTISEFWRRWHISLGSWFRDYVYFPLGGSRVNSRWKLVRNLLVVWCLTGIWHGANWTFIIWGVLYGAFIIFEKLTDIPNRIKNWASPIREGYRFCVLLVLITGWTIFRSDSLSEATKYLGTMFGNVETVLLDDQFSFYFREYIVYFLCGVFCATPILKGMTRVRQNMGIKMADTCLVLFLLLQLILFLISLSCLVMNSHNPFIYFNF